MDSKLFNDLVEAESHRRVVAKFFTEEIDDYLIEINQDSKKITTNLLEAFFRAESKKCESVQDSAKETFHLLRTFDEAAFKILDDVAAILLELNSVQSTLKFQSVATPIRAISNPIEVTGHSKIEIEKNIFSSIERSRTQFNEKFIGAVIEATKLEKQVQHGLWKSTELLMSRRKLLWDFRKEYLSVSWHERLQRSIRESQRVTKEIIYAQILEATEILSKELTDVALDIAKIKLAIRLMKAAGRVAGKKEISCELNDTDYMHKLLRRLDSENKEFEKFCREFDEIKKEIEAIRKDVEECFTED